MAVRTLEEVARETLAAHHLSVDELDVYIPHQANLRIIKAVADRLNLPLEKVVLNMDRYGNTSAASTKSNRPKQLCNSRSKAWVYSTG